MVLNTQHETIISCAGHVQTPGTGQEFMKGFDASSHLKGKGLTPHLMGRKSGPINSAY